MRLKQLLSPDQANLAVFLSVSSQAWMALAGPMTIVAVAHALAPAVQGFYYTFTSVLAIQVFFELGLTTVLVQLASHEWASLTLKPDGTIGGSELAISRLSGIARLAVRWYAAAGVLLALLFLVGGGWFFASGAEQQSVHWRTPWSLLGLLTSAYLMVTPLLSIVEGCNQIASIYRIRLAQSILSSLVTIGALLGGLGLYSLALGSAVRLSLALYWLLWPQRQFLRLLLQPTQEGEVDWFTEIWPFQWRIAVSWLSGYFIFSLFTPTMFKAHGAVAAGQMGMTLTLVGAVESISCSWLYTRTPQFGGLIAKSDFATLDRLFNRSLALAMVTAICGGAAVVVAVLGLPACFPIYADRLLPLWPTVILVVYRILNVYLSGLALYLRAHKREPLMGISVVNAILVATMTYFVARPFGASGIATGLLVVTLGWALPSFSYVFSRCRRLWHALPHSP